MVLPLNHQLVAGDEDINQEAVHLRKIQVVGEAGLVLALEAAVGSDLVQIGEGVYPIEDPIEDGGEVVLQCRHRLEGLFELFVCMGGVSAWPVLILLSIRLSSVEEDEF